ncbi:hypothetical protein B1218_36165 [Pseudomonas ogarae]|nr:hypothetical protein B1218_36165 [Pseudomonas ogarae]
MALCLFVEAGASQFAALALICIGASLTTIVLTRFPLAAPHSLLSCCLGVGRRGLALSRGVRWCYAAGLRDAAWACRCTWHRAGSVLHAQPPALVTSR